MLDINRFADSVKSIDFLSEQYNAACALREKSEENEIIVSVIGQFKRGKSSLVNALLGENILPVGIIPLTTVITEIRYGDGFDASVCFDDGKEKKISEDELEDYCSEEKNPGNGKGVKTVKIWTKSHPFGPGIVFVDTPGVGSVNEHNTRSSAEYVEKSDAVVFLLSVDSPVSETERDFLVETSKYTSRFFFGVNKCDTVSEKDLSAFLGFCKKTIEKSIGSQIRIFPVSAKTGEGIDNLRNMLSEELKKSHGQILEDSVSKKMEIVKEQAEAKLKLAISAASVPADQLRAKLSNISKSYSEASDFADELQVISKHRTDKLIEKIKEELDLESEKLIENAMAECQKIYQENSGLPASEFEKKFQEDINSYLNGILTSLNKRGLELLHTGYSEITDILCEKASETARFTAGMLKSEFGLDYPVEEIRFEVSSKSDFFLRIGRSTKFMPDASSFNRLLPRKTANRKFMESASRRASDDIDKNKNNMIYNYKYKMQESLLVLCIQLSERVNKVISDLLSLTEHIEKNLSRADLTEKEEEKLLMKTLEEIQNM